MNTNQQSVIGFRPSSTTSVQDGQQFLIGRMVHYNNPINANDRFSVETMNVVLSGFTAPKHLGVQLELDEEPYWGPGCCNDLLDFTNQIADTTPTQGGLSFRLS